MSAKPEGVIEAPDRHTIVSTPAAPETPVPSVDKVAAKRRARNYVLAAVLLAWVALVYIISLTRMGGAS
jgi:uncharacterized membrane protein